MSQNLKITRYKRVLKFMAWSCGLILGSCVSHTVGVPPRLFLYMEPVICILSKRRAVKTFPAKSRNVCSVPI